MSVKDPCAAVEGVRAEECGRRWAGWCYVAVRIRESTQMDHQESPDFFRFHIHVIIQPASLSVSFHSV